MTNTTIVSTLLDYLDSHRGEIIDFACELVAAPSPNPPGDERAVAKVILSKLEKLGLQGADVLFRAQERPNIVYHKRGSAGAPKLILSGHLDTKPVDEQDRRLWKTDPLVPTIIDAKLYGLGAADMKGGIASMIYAVAALCALEIPLRGDLMLILTANEESVGEYGADWLVKNHDIQADFCLVADTAGMETDFDFLHITARNTVIFKVKVFGSQMHSSISDRFPSVNASVKMGWVMWRMARDLKLDYQPHPLYPKGPTVNLGDIVKGGHSYGTLSGYAEFAGDIRIHPGMSRMGVVKDLQDFLEQLRHEDPNLRVELEIVGGLEERPWKWLQGDEPFISILQSASERVLSRRPPLGGFPAFTDGYWFHTYAGIPTIPAFGPGLLPLAHTPNEWVSLEAIVQAGKIYALAAMEYLNS